MAAAVHGQGSGDTRQPCISSCCQQHKLRASVTAVFAHPRQITPESKGTTAVPPASQSRPPASKSPPHLGPLAASHEGIGRVSSACTGSPWLPEALFSGRSPWFSGLFMGHHTPGGAGGALERDQWTLLRRYCNSALMPFVPLQRLSLYSPQHHKL